MEEDNISQGVYLGKYIKTLFSGRIGRRDWFFTQLILIGSFLPIPIVFLYILPESAFPVAMTVSFIVIWVFSFSLNARRLHDTGRSGWWSLTSFIPLVGLYWLYLVLSKGDPTPNKYGNVPARVANFYKTLLNKQETSRLQKIRKDGPFIAGLASFLVVYISLFVFHSIWTSLLLGLLVALVFIRNQIRQRGPNYLLVAIVIYLIVFFFLLLYLTVIDNEYNKDGCFQSTSHVLPCATFRFLKPLLKY